MSILPWAPYNRLPPQLAEIVLQQKRPCPLSGNEDEMLYFEIPDFQFFEDQKGQNRILHRVVQNPHSGLFYTNPCYTTDGFHWLFKKAGFSYTHHPTLSQKQAHWVTEHLPETQSICDVGCGQGEFLKALPAHWHKVGIDVDLLTLNRIQKEQPDITFFCQDLETFTLTSVPDVISLFDVLEHLSNPLAILRHFRSLAAQKTKLVIEVPVLEASAASQCQDIVGLFSVMHLTHFSQSTLFAMLAKAGWRVVLSVDVELHSGLRVIAEPDTPQDIVLDHQQIQHDAALGQTYLKQWQKNCARNSAQLDTIPQGMPVLIWGAGLHTEYLDRLTPLFTSHRQYLIVDTDFEKVGTRYHGISIIHPDQISAQIWHQPDFKIVISTYGSQGPVSEALRAKNVPDSAVIRFYN